MLKTTKSKTSNLQIEKDRLKELMTMHSNQLKADVDGIKDGFKPVGDVVGSIGKFATKDGKRKLLYAVVDISMALLTKKIILTKSNWFNNLALPILVRSLSTEPLQAKEKGAFDVLNSFLKKWLVKKLPALR